jgi:hypothetical protein
MAVTGKSASRDGDRLKTHDVDPAFPQSVEHLCLGPPSPRLRSAGDLLIRVGFQRSGNTASEDI